MVGRQADPGQSGKEAGEEVIRRDAGVDPGMRRVIGLSGDVRDGQQRGQPERDPEGRRFQILAEPVAFQAEVADADGHERKRGVEGGNRVRGAEPVRIEQGREDEHPFVDDSEGDDKP